MTFTHTPHKTLFIYCMSLLAGIHARNALKYQITSHCVTRNTSTENLASNSASIINFYFNTSKNSLQELSNTVNMPTRFTETAVRSHLVQLSIHGKHLCDIMLPSSFRLSFSNTAVMNGTHLSFALH